MTIGLKDAHSDGYVVDDVAHGGRVIWVVEDAHHVLLSGDDKLAPAFQTVKDVEDVGKDEAKENQSVNKSNNKEKDNNKKENLSEEEKKKVVKREVFSWIRLLAIAVAVALCINYLILFNGYVPSGSIITRSVFLSSSRKRATFPSIYFRSFSIASVLLSGSGLSERLLTSNFSRWI